MNNPNPFVPQGSFLEQKSKARARLKFAVISSISLSVVVLVALLIQGCRRNDTAENTVDTNTAMLPMPTNTDLGSTTSIALPEVTNTTPPPLPPPPPPPVGTEYTVVKGDNFATIAKSMHVSVKAIQDANPTVDPKKLQIGQKLQIPAPSTPVPSVSGAPTSVAEPVMGAEQTYKVKSGDTLTSVAKQFHTTIKAIQSANNMTTTSIRVGQTLKIPVKATPPPAPAPVPEAPAPPPVTTPAPATPPQTR